ncbi:hypothetical protein LTR17_027415 [Elasticomyces elasticus]|nr:hypothetical protein LTR17_027415 [Elasticomyces elasticus]
MTAVPSYTRPTLTFMLKSRSTTARPPAGVLAESRKGFALFKDAFGLHCKQGASEAMSLDFYLADESHLTAAASVDDSMKRKKCTTCLRRLSPGQFPKHPEGSKCQHERETCRTCWRQWLEAQVASKQFDQITCAQCDNVMGPDEIKLIAMPAVFERI